MSSPEHIFRPREYHAPDSDSGAGFGGVLEPKNIRSQFDADAFITLIATESTNPNVLYNFEEQLRNAGYLSKLEETGVMPPAPQNPNPYSIIQEAEDHLLWALQHQEETDKYMRAVEQRESILRYLYIGGIMGERLSDPNP